MCQLFDFETLERVFVSKYLRWSSGSFWNRALTIKKYNIKLMKGKAPRKHSLHEKTAASVFIKAVY